MSGIWAVKNKEDNGTVKFTNPGSDVSSSDFAQCLTQAQKDAIVENFTDTSGVMSLEHISLLMPTRQNVEAISEYMQEQIKSAFEDNGISADPPVTFKMDGYGNVTAQGDRSDLSKINGLLDSGTTLGSQMRNFMGMAADMPRFERAMEYTEKYEQAQSQAEIDALNKKYADLFDGKDHSYVSVSYGSGGLDVNASYMA